MTRRLPLVQIADLLTPISRPVTPEPRRTYALLGAHLYAGGLYAKDMRSGAEVRAGKLFCVREGDFVYNRLFAWLGSFAVASASNDGSYVSNEFLVYKVDIDRLDPYYLWLLFSRKSAWNEVRGLSSGSTPASRNRLKGEKFLGMSIPLLPLIEQRRLVAQVGRVRSLIEEVYSRRERSLASIGAAVASEEMRIWPADALHEAPTLSEVTRHLSRGRQSRQGESEHYLVKTRHVQMGRYVRSDMTLAPEVAAKVPPDAVVRPGDVLIACSAAGCLGRVAIFEDRRRVASTDTHVAIARASSGVLPQYLFAYLRGAQGQLQLRSRERGNWKRPKVTFRLTELNLADLTRVPVPVPSLPRQKQIVDRLSSLYSRADAANVSSQLQVRTLAAVVPAVLHESLA